MTYQVNMYIKLNQNIEKQFILYNKTKDEI